VYIATKKKQVHPSWPVLFYLAIQAPLAHSGPLPPRAVHVQCGAVRGLCGGCLQSGKADVSDLRRRSLAPARLSDCVMLAYSWQQWKVPYDVRRDSDRVPPPSPHALASEKICVCCCFCCCIERLFGIPDSTVTCSSMVRQAHHLFHLFYLYTCRCSDKPHTAHPHGSDIHFINPSTDQIPP
jgi:hypothetical protein